MDTQEKILLTILVVLAVVAVYITFVQPPQPEGAHAEELLKTAIEVGKGHDEYLYSYRETSNGYAVEYVLFVKGGEKMIEVKNPLSTKRVYLLENDTILCASFMNVESCSSMKNNTESYVLDYFAYLESKLFDDQKMEDESERLSYFIEKGYLTLLPDTPEKTVNGRTCEELSYTIDYTDMTVSEASRYGVSPSSPRIFNWKLCVDETTGLAYSKYFNYTHTGKEYDWNFLLLEADWDPADEITAPENLTDDLAYYILVEESNWQSELQLCLSYSEKNKEKCIHDLALILKMKSLCDMTGERRDMCLVGVAGLTLDEAICPEIEEVSFRDDCYIEMAGGKKESGYCSMLENVSKMEYCMNVSQIEPEENTTGIANPAAVNCESRGYDYEIRTDNETGGEYGVCMNAGLECEEWALFRTECCLLDEDCSDGATCVGQECIAEPEEETNDTVDMEEFMNYIDNIGEDNETADETANETANETESS